VLVGDLSSSACILLEVVSTPTHPSLTCETGGSIRRECYESVDPRRAVVDNNAKRRGAADSILATNIVSYLQIICVSKKTSLFF
jgi:hypothetical protein